MIRSLAALAFFVVIARALRRLKLTWPVVLVFVAGVAVRFGYLSVTPFSVRGHDADAHVDYIEYLVTHHGLPNPNDGGVFYQPPLYYALAAGLWKALTAMGVHSRETILWALQVQSVVYQLSFLVFSILTAALWLDLQPDGGFDRGLSSRRGVHALFVALLCLWPSAIIHSVRLGNDDLLYLWFGAGLYFTARWWIAGRNRDLNLAAGCGALGMLTKSNALLLFVLLAALLGARFVNDKEREFNAHLKRAWPTIALALLSIGTVLGRAAIDTALGKRSNVLVGNSDRLNGDLAVGNGAANYLWFDAKIFVTEAFTSPWDDAKGRQFFWNYVLKTSLFGEFSFERVWLSNVAVVLSLLLLLLAGCLALGLFLDPGMDFLKELPALVVGVTLVLSLMALRASIPKSCSNDFRYILPVVTPFLYLYVRSLTVFRQRGWTRLATGAQALGWAFATLSTTFFVVLAVSGH